MSDSEILGDLKQVLSAHAETLEDLGELWDELYRHPNPLIGRTAMICTTVGALCYTVVMAPIEQFRVETEEHRQRRIKNIAQAAAPTMIADLQAMLCQNQQENN